MENLFSGLKVLKVQFYDTIYTLMIMNVFEHESTCDSNFGYKKLVTIFVCYRTSETKFVDDKLEILMTDSVICLIRVLYFF